MNKTALFLVALGLLVPASAHASPVEIVEHPVLTDYTKDDTIVFTAKVKNNGAEPRSIALRFFIGRSDQNMKLYAYVPIIYSVDPGETGSPPDYRIVRFPASTLKGGKWNIYAQAVEDGCYDLDLNANCVVYDTKAITTYIKNQ